MPVGIGILGFAHAHVLMYCARWNEMSRDDVRLVGAWDHDDTRALPTGVSRESSADALLARRDVDAVVIAAETSMHADLVERAAAAEKAIVLQKPIALTMDQADRIVAAVRKHGVPFTLAWQMRVDPQNAHMRELVRGGSLGRIYMVRRRHGLPSQTWPDFDKSWHVKPELNRGMWADDASHAIDFLYWMLGEPVSVTAEISTLRSPNVPDDNGIAIFRYADGTIAEVVCSFVCLAGENTTEIVGEEGVVIQNFGDVPSCNVPRANSGPGYKVYMKSRKGWVFGAPSPRNHADRINALAPEILKFLQGKREPIATAQEGRDVLRMTLASYRAAETGRRVTISEIN
jgi:predicted dehydrogenase